MNQIESPYDQALINKIAKAVCRVLKQDPESLRYTHDGKLKAPLWGFKIDDAKLFLLALSRAGFEIREAVK